jgi:hypothetical protein
MENHGGMISAGENSRFVHHSSPAILQADSSNSKIEGTDEGNNEFGLMKYLYSNFEGFLNTPLNLTTWVRHPRRP